MGDLERAIAFACEAHAGQVDKQGEPYVLHCLRVMLAVGPEARRVAVLHDVVEDTAYTLDEVDARLDLWLGEMVALGLLTRGEVPYSQYIDALAEVGTRLAREVKVADLRDNLARWTPEIGADLKARYERALGRLRRGDA